MLLVFSILHRRYKGAYMEVFWAMLNPLITMLVLALVLPLVIKFRMDNYVIYLFSEIIFYL